MAWYRAGTISVNNGSATVTGSGTAFVANVGIGQGLIAPDGRTYEIANVISNTQLTLAGPYLGASASAQGYAIIPTQSYMQDLASGVSQLISDFSGVRDGVGQGLFGDGSAAVPSIRFAGDQDTGIYRHTTNILGISAGGSLRMSVSPNGVGVGVLSPASALNVVGDQIIAGSSAGTNSLGVQIKCQALTAIPSPQVQAYIGIGDSSLGTAGDLLIAPRTNAGGNVRFITGTTPAERLRITHNGDIGIGTDNPASFGAGQTTLQLKGNSANQPNRGGIFRATSFDGDCDAFMGVRADDLPCIRSLSSHPFLIYTNNIERARFDTAGNLLIRKPVVGSAGDGAILGVWSAFTRTSGAPLALRRDGTNGSILDIFKADAIVGSISVSETATAYNTASDARLKYDIEDAPDASALIDDIRIRTFRWNADDSVERYGVIAQELVEVAPEAVTGSPDSEEMMAVDFSKLVPMLIKEVQSLRGRLAGQEAAMASLEARLAALEAA